MALLAFFYCLWNMDDLFNDSAPAHLDADHVKSPFNLFWRVESLNKSLGGDLKTESLAT